MGYDMEEKKMKILLISKAVLKKLDILHDNFHLDRSTFIRMAVYHGLENIENGYYPYRNLNIRRMERKKYKVTLPKSTWHKIDDVLKKINYIPKKNTLEKKMDVLQNIPCGELVEMFIRMEIKGYVDFTNIYIQNDDDSIDDYELFNEYETVNITAQIPRLFYDKITDTMDKTGLTEGKVERYLIIKSLFHEYYRTELTAIDTDVDLIRYIDNFGFNRIKAISFLRALAENDKIVFLNDRKMDY